MRQEQTLSLHSRQNDALLQAIIEIYHRVDALLAGTFHTENKLKAYLGGGAAAYMYAGVRPSYDIDCEFDSRRIIIPDDVFVPYTDADGKPRMVFFDRNYTPQFAMMHEDYQQDSRLVLPACFERIELRVFSPVDLCVSKISRLGETDIFDIQTIVRHGYCTPQEIRIRAQEALVGAIGDVRRLQTSIDLAVSYAEEAYRLWEQENESKFE